VYPSYINPERWLCPRRGAPCSRRPSGIRGDRRTGSQCSRGPRRRRSARRHAAGGDRAAHVDARGREDLVVDRVRDGDPRMRPSTSGIARVARRLRWMATRKRRIDLRRQRAEQKLQPRRARQPIRHDHSVFARRQYDGRQAARQRRNRHPEGRMPHLRPGPLDLLSVSGGADMRRTLLPVGINRQSGITRPCSSRAGDSRWPHRPRPANGSRSRRVGPHNRAARHRPAGHPWVEEGGDDHERRRKTPPIS